MPRLEAPVAMFVFNRPDLASQVLDAILDSGCTTLYVIADGPRSDRPGESALCSRTRAVIERARSSVNLLTNYSDHNMGLRARISSGLDWVFRETPQAILLEDDCLPDSTFFPFCDEMLRQYADDPRVMMVSGNNFLLGRKTVRDSYYFSRYVHIWGWATWRRAWALYDVHMRGWPSQRDGRWLSTKLGSKAEARYWRRIFDDVHSGRINTWDYQWGYSCLVNDGLSIVPAQHLVTNLGAGPDATNTLNTGDPHFLAKAGPLALPLQHPPVIECDEVADHLEFRNLFGSQSRTSRLLRRLRRKLARL
ncbi:MAG: glycosyltransferase family 2 protein [Candidatus Hydrogenedentes bacterium]|nr:glycosyltransferase family 2 protein [Candidatus Hydrogenedentota bacterium]